MSQNNLCDTPPVVYSPVVNSPIVSSPIVNYTPAYRRYVLILLTLVYALNFIDRQILVILQESIKADMDLSDTQLGLLTGFAFAVFYVSVGIPIARWADIGNRRNIIAIAIAVWSAMTALSGLTHNFFQLLLARIGVGVGEAGGSPPAHSILSDYYPPEQRGTAMSFYSTGVYIGVLLGFLIGGWINHTFGWRLAFLVVGLPGILVAILVRLTLREPVRGQADKVKMAPGTRNQGAKFSETIATLWRLKSFRYFSIGTGLAAFISYGTGNFLPSFLIRTHGFSSLEVGTSLALIAGFGGGVGTFLGGYLADKLAVKDIRWYMWIAALPVFVNMPLLLLALFSSNATLVLAFLFFATMSGAFYLGPAIATTHTLLSPRMRAMGSAILFLILNLIGLGLGPLFVGFLSDLLTPTFGEHSLRYALAITAFVAVLAALCFAMAANRLPEDLQQQSRAADTPDWEKSPA